MVALVGVTEARRIVGRGVGVGLCIASILRIQMGVAAAAPPRPVEVGVGGYGLLTAIACPASTQCTAVDVGADVATFDPVASGLRRAGNVAPSGGTAGVLAVSCPAIMRCAVSAPRDDAVGFDPQVPATAEAVDLHADLGAPVRTVACAPSNLCVAVDAIGEAVPFDPQRVGADDVPLPTRQRVDPGVYLSYPHVTCPSGGECVLVDDHGTEVTFDPQDGHVVSKMRIDEVARANHAAMGSVSCPSLDQCTTVDTRGGAVTFDPLTTTIAPARIVVDASGGAVNAVACPSTVQCTLVDNRAGAATFDPAAPRPAARTVIDPGGGPLIDVALDFPRFRGHLI